VLLALIALAGCEKKSAVAVDERPVVVATTTMLADLCEQIGGDAVRVEGIMSPGGDPHLYQPTPTDARLVAHSDLVVKSGLKLEGWIDDLLENAGGTRPTVVASDGVDPIRMDGFVGGVDPHFWFDITSWKVAANNTGQGLIALVGADTPEGKAVRNRLDAHLVELDRLDTWVDQELASIPTDQRVLITSHDAFNYFGRAYDIDVVGIQGVSTDQEASQRDLANIIELVKRRGAPAVFVETSVNPALIEQVARETGARVAGPLYSDSIGASNSPASTFVGTVSENVRMITEALGGKHSPFGEGTS
jgi:ABC-type Zn uptake system ZnuABC Zn-binding protein ZnuA